MQVQFATLLEETGENFEGHYWIVMGYPLGPNSLQNLVHQETNEFQIQLARANCPYSLMMKGSLRLMIVHNQKGLERVVHPMGLANMTASLNYLF